MEQRRSTAIEIRRNKKNRDMKLSSPSHTVAIAYGAPQHTVETEAVGWMINCL